MTEQISQGAGTAVGTHKEDGALARTDAFDPSAHIHLADRYSQRPPCRGRSGCQVVTTQAYAHDASPLLYAQALECAWREGLCMRPMLFGSENEVVAAHSAVFVVGVRGP